MSLNWTNIEAIIFDVFELYRRSNRQITPEFTDNPDLQEILRDKTELITPEAFDQIQAHLNENFFDILLKWIEREFDYSTGALALSFEEFSEFFQLDKDVTTTIINKMLAMNTFVLQKETDQEVGRIQLDPRFSRNYWVKSELVPREAESLLEIGALLNNPLISGLKRTSIKNRHLIRLDLRSLNLGWIPDSIGDFPYLRELVLQNNLLVSLPKTIGKLTSLKYLDIESNLIKFLPDTIGKLKKLEQLYTRSNELESLPDTIGELKSLKRLSIANNQISSLPESLTELKDLFYLDVRETLIINIMDLAKIFPNVHFPAVSSIPKGTPREFLPFSPLGSNLSIQRSFLTDDDLFQILKPQYYQIFVLGNKGAGKTSLLNRNFRNIFNDDSPGESDKLLEKHIINDSILYSAVDPVLLTANIQREAKDRREVWDKEPTLKKNLISIEKEQNCFEFWEIDEEDLFSQFEMALFHSCDGILLCVDVSNQQSVDRVISTLEYFFTLIIIMNMNEIKKIPILLVGTKGDEIDLIVESKILHLCQELENNKFNLVSFHMNAELRFFSEWNKLRQFKFPFSPELWINTSAKTGKNVSLAFKIIEIATKEQQRANDFKRMYSSKKRRKNDFEDFPSPYIYYYPYPKGPPVASGQARAKKVYCPHCDKAIDYMSKSCPYCGKNLNSS